MNSFRRFSALVIEDNVEVAEIISEIVEETCYGRASVDISSVPSLQASVDKIIDNHYDIIFLDLNLSDGHGNEILEVRGFFKSKSTPVIVLSGDLTGHTTLKDDNIIFLPKPFSFTQIATYIKIFLLKEKSDLAS